MKWLLSGLLFSLPLFGSITLQSIICYPVTQPTITAPATTVDSFTTTTILKGDASAASTLALIINGSDFASLTADQQNHYQIQVPIVPGNNVFSLVSSNSCSSELSDPFTVAAPLASITDTSASTQTPSVTLNAPQKATTEATETTTQTTPAKEDPVIVRGAPAITLTSAVSDHDASSSTFYITGTTNKPSRFNITDNDKIVTTIKKELTSFGVAIPLEPGDNNVVVTAIASDGQWSRQSLTLAYNDPASSVWYESTPSKVIVGGVDIILIATLVVLVLL